MPNKARPTAGDKADGHPKILNKITGWVVGVTALLAALAGLWTVLKPIIPGLTRSDLPVRYEKPHGLIELRDGTWYETDEQNQLENPFEEISRKDGRTVVYDDSRDLYLRWPNGGGTVQWSKSNPMIWRDLYIVKPRRAEADSN